MPERVAERLGDNVRRIRHIESASERQAREAAETLRTQVLGQVRGAEGQSIAALTAAQQRALLVPCKADVFEAAYEPLRRGGA